MKLPHNTQYTYKVKGGESGFCFVRINPKYKHDKGLHAHEYEHIKQWYFFTSLGLTISSILYLFIGWNALVLAPFSFVLSGFLYTYIRPVRQWMEVQAFKKQIPYYDWDCREYFANRLMNDYELYIDQRTALKLLG